MSKYKHLSFNSDFNINKIQDNINNKTIDYRPKVIPIFLCRPIYKTTLPKSIESPNENKTYKPIEFSWIRKSRRFHKIKLTKIIKEI